MLAKVAMLTVALGVVLPVPGARGAAPPNDNRKNATPIGAPTAVSGSTVGATKDPSDPRTYCGNADGTLWYRLAGAAPGPLVLRLTAGGDLDAIVAVFHAVRSQVAPQSCAATDPKGKAALPFNVERGETYLIEVGRAVGSPDGNFQFRLFRPEASSRPPGKPLPRGGVSTTVDPLVDFDDAWSFTMTPGVPYRVNLAPPRRGCVSLALYKPGTRSFAASRPIHTLRCGGYLTYTPGPKGRGRYTLLVTASSTRPGPERYHLSAGPAGPDDTAPGMHIANLQTRHGRLFGRGLDVVDLYRFDVARRSDVTLRLRTRGSASFDLLVIGETGRRVGCECGSSGSASITKRLSAGHYFAVVRARRFTQGAYSLSLLVRQITATSVTVAGRPGAEASRGQAVPLTVHVSFANGGRVRLRIERFDPLMGWQFYRVYALRIDPSGTATASFRAPTAGRWRARAFYIGTRTSSPSKSGAAVLVVR